MASDKHLKAGVETAHTVPLVIRGENSQEVDR